MQSTDGQSQPSVSSMELHNTLYLPASKSFNTSACPGCLRLLLPPGNHKHLGDPGTSGWSLPAAEIPQFFYPLQYFCISWAIPSRYGSSAVPISLALKSPACTETLLISILSGIVSALIGDRYPSLIALGRVYS